MAETKRKTRDETKAKKGGDNKKKMRKQSNSNAQIQDRKNKNGGRRKKTGPHLPNALRKEVDLVNNRSNDRSNGDEEIDFDGINDVYEYEEELPEEESKKNRRYDPVENFEYELPEQFKVWDELSISLRYLQI